MRASFLGVGAPEAVLVGVVALVVFGPKGLAQAAKSLGATLRAFAPTIRELTQVSSELKSTLEDEIGLKDLREELQRPAVPTPRAPRAVEAADSDAEGTTAASSDAAGSLSDLTASMQRADDGMDGGVDPDIEQKRAEAARMAWGGESPAAAPAAPLSGMSDEELEAELARRKASTGS